ncbi:MULTISPECIES: hypothetical protein [Vibrio harveyi group]|uniref:hypothetical protein n=1 Tax=Vibrio harveyi group TaxID=717610 RepID=UPI001110C60B|nr:hypothetical protein [Vibrio parahaemolyticus]MDG2761595.1 hypothetical protein [Vibrio parahaemolyticus]TMX40846.1 hypothetical protein DA098_03175 [Vibrio parahaemolyticus]TMX79849.1 hypothetical protein DA094_05025 [Vibrio parahaemolyticus]
MKSMNTVTFHMVKKLDAITNSPYGVWIASLPTGQTSIKLSKLDQVDFQEGARLSIKGVEAVTKVIKEFSADDQHQVNQIMDRIQSDWAQNKEKHDSLRSV